MANNLQSTAKQGVGFAMIVDGEEFVGKISNPGNLATPRTDIDTSHTGLTSSKTSIPEELADPFELTLEVQFDPRLDDLITAQTGTGVQTEREIFLVFPKVPDALGATLSEHGYVLLPAGRLSSEGIDINITDIMKQSIKVSSGNSEPTFVKQANAVAKTDLVFTQTAPAATTTDGLLLGTFSTAVAGPAVYTLDAGGDAASVTLKGNKLYAVGVLSADLTISVTVNNWVGYRNDIVAQAFTNAAVAVDLTA
tara:strand:- start:6941 stop:7696 length:756 start_codon:yes stop_codon:yes gene_type:complete